MAAQVQRVAFGLEAVRGEGSEVAAHLATSLAEGLGVRLGQMRQVQQVSSKVVALTSVLLVYDCLASVEIAQRCQLALLGLGRPPLQTLLDIPPEFLLGED